MNSTPRILVLAPRSPLPQSSGTQIREYKLLEALSDRADVTLVTLLQSGEGADRLEELEQVATVRPVPHDRSKLRTVTVYPLSSDPYRAVKFNTSEFESEVTSTLREETFDLIWANFLNTVELLPSETTVPVVLDEHNADVRYWNSFRTGNLVERMFARTNIGRIRRFRERVRDRIDGVVSVSEDDAEEARGWAEAPVWVLPNGVDTEQFSPEMPADETEKEILFVGSLDVRMNEEAVEWFLDEAWPSIHRRDPNSTFRIVGRNPTARIERRRSDPGVELVGDVPSVVPYYESASVVVAPLAFGGGTKLKVLEAMSMARPLVTTPTGTTGIDSVGDSVVLCDRGEGFADAVVSLLDDPESRRLIGNKARSFVEGRFSWSAVTGETLDEVFSRYVE